MHSPNSNLSESESKILDAAKNVFLRKGMDGARMQEIADEAGINKSLLHYYFRSKEKLFEAVFQSVIQNFFSKINTVIDSNVPFEEKISFFVDTYFKFFKENPYLPNFILNELSKNPNSDSVEKYLKRNINVKLVMDIFNSETRLMQSKNIDPIQFLVSLLSLCIFPFIAKPIFSELIFENDSEKFDHFLEERKKHIVQFITAAINNQSQN